MMAVVEMREREERHFAIEMWPNWGLYDSNPSTPLFIIFIMTIPSRLMSRWASYPKCEHGVRIRRVLVFKRPYIDGKLE